MNRRFRDEFVATHADNAAPCVASDAIGIGIGFLTRLLLVAGFGISFVVL